MALGQRFLRVNLFLLTASAAAAAASLSGQSGPVNVSGTNSSDIEFDETMDVRVKIKKQALAVQQTAEIEIFGVSQTVRQKLMTQVTAFNARQVNFGSAIPANPLITVRSAYVDGDSISTAIKNGLARPDKNVQTSGVPILFSGYAIACEPIGGPPNLGIRIKCATRQIDKTKYISGLAPVQCTFNDYATWVANQLGVTLNINTSYADKVVTNPSSQTIVLSALIMDLQALYRPHVVAWVDGYTLYVRDIDRLSSGAQTLAIGDFVGTPLWTEWGVRFQTFANKPLLDLANGVQLHSILNPGVNGAASTGAGGTSTTSERTYVVGMLEYDLTSRGDNFMVTADVYPAA